MANDPMIPGVDIPDCDHAGYKPVLVSDGDWMIAVMNGTEDSWRVPAKLEKHPDTDELFVLVAGRAVMVSGGGGERPGSITCAEMTSNVPYLVRAGTWHATVPTPGARFIIVERTGTNIGGSVAAELTDEQMSQIALPEDGS